ncbi:MAG: hypothetical protein ACP5D7_10740 [Limnospira sp.]
MKIEIESNDFDEKCYCHLCGNPFRPREVVARAYRDSGEFLSEVCPECIAKGSESVSDRMHRRAQTLRAIASELDRLAGSDICAPTLEQLNVMNQVVNALR